MNKIQVCSVSRQMIEQSSSDSQIVVIKPVALGTSGTLLKVQILRPYHRLTESEKLGVCFNKFSDSETYSS